MKREKYIIEALAIWELSVDLENISSDDKKEVDEYSVNEIVKEAEYVLGLYYEGGTMSSEERLSEDKELRAIANKKIRQLKGYIRKYKRK